MILQGGERRADRLATYEQDLMNKMVVNFLDFFSASYIWIEL